MGARTNRLEREKCQNAISEPVSILETAPGEPREPELTPALVRKALVERRGASVARMLRHLTPIVQANVARVLLRRESGGRGRDLRQEVADLTQAVFEKLLADDGRRLLEWDDGLGSASTYFGMLTRHYVHNALDSRRQSPWAEHPSEPAFLESRADVDPDFERVVASKNFLERLLEKFDEELNPRDRELFDLMFLQHREESEIRQTLGLTRDALYQARHRLIAKARTLALRLCGGETSSWEA